MLMFVAGAASVIVIEGLALVIAAAYIATKKEVEKNDKN